MSDTAVAFLPLSLIVAGALADAQPNNDCGREP